MSATVEFFEQNFIVGQYECDCNGRMKAGALMAQSQAISTNHCNELGLTIDVYRRKAGCLFLTQLPGNAKQAGKD